MGTSDVDLRTAQAPLKERYVGFAAIRLALELDAPEATDEQLEGLRARTERYCTVLQTLHSPPAVSASFKRA